MYSLGCSSPLLPYRTTVEHAESCVANDGSAEQWRQAPSGFGVHTGGGTSRPAARYGRTSFGGILPGANSGLSTSGHVF